MSEPTTERILQAWDEAEDEFPENSTEFLAAIVADRIGVEYGDVIDALWTRRVK